MDIFLNREELKALLGFLIIYTSSALILMIIIAILYHNNETNKNMFLNWKVLSSYFVAFLIMFVNSAFIYKHIYMNQIGMIDALGYIFVPILSFVFLSEKLNAKQIVGIVLIVIGVLLYSI